MTLAAMLLDLVAMVHPNVDVSKRTIITNGGGHVVVHRPPLRGADCARLVDGPTPHSQKGRGSTRGARTTWGFRDYAQLTVDRGGNIRLVSRRPLIPWSPVNLPGRVDVGALQQLRRRHPSNRRRLVQRRRNVYTVSCCGPNDEDTFTSCGYGP